MRPIDFPTANVRYNAPRDWDDDKDGPCDTLAVLTHSDGFLVSLWRPTWRERLQLLLGRPIQLWLRAARHPVVSMQVDEELAG